MKFRKRKKNLTRAHIPSRISLPLLAFGAVVVDGGCVDLVIPPDAIIACGDDGACPDDTTCNTTLNRCVPAEPIETDPPVASNVVVDPPAVKAGTSFTVALSVDEPLGIAPVIVVDDLALTLTSGALSEAAPRLIYAGTAGGTEAQGLRAITATLVDVWGNTAADVDLGRVEFDFVAPVLADPDLAPIVSDPHLSFTLDVTGATRLLVSGDLTSNLDVPVSGNSVVVDVDLSAGDGAKAIHLDARDAADNAATLDLTVTLSSSRPLSAPSLSLPAGQSAVKDDDLVQVGGAVTPGAALVGVRLVDEDGAAVADVDGVSVSGGGSLSGIIALGALGASSSVRLEVIAEKDGVQSLAGASRSNPLAVDNVAPAAASCALPAVVGNVAATLQLSALDFVDVAIAGDVVAQSFAPLTETSLPIVLTGGDGTKSVTASFRDGAHNITTCTATTRLDSSIPAVLSVALLPPAGQLDVKDADSVVVDAVLDEAGDVVSAARLVDEDGAVVGSLADLVVSGDSVSGTFVVGDVVAAGVSRFALELEVTNGATTSAPLRSNFLTRDNVAPTAPVLSAPTDAASFVVDIDVAGCAGATALAVSGDVAQNDGVFVPFTSPDAVTVTLSAGIGNKAIAVVCRDNAFNLSSTSTATIALTTDDVLSVPALTLPEIRAGRTATAVKNGVALAVAGVGEPGATVQSVRLVDIADDSTVETFATSSVTVGAAGGLSGTLTPSALVDGTQVALEVVLFARGRASVAADSRSAAVDVDAVAPDALPAAAVALNETNADPFRVAAIDDTVFVFAVAAGAVEAGTFVELATDAAFNDVIATRDIAIDGGINPVELGAQASPVFFARVVDGAGNTAATTRIEGAAFSATLSPSTAKAGDTVTVSLTSTVPVRPDAFLFVDGRGATLVSATATTLVFSYVVTGAEAEGLVLSRVLASPAALASTSTSTFATVHRFDFTAPAITAARISVTQNAPGQNDSVQGVADAIVDERGASVTLTLVETSAAQDIASGAPFAFSLGDNAHATATLRARDEAGNTSELSLSNDITAPNIDIAKLTLAQNDPGTADRMGGAAGAIVDAVGVASATVNGSAIVVAGNGSFSDVSLGDNVVATVAVSAVDAAGNRATVSVDNDIAAPVLSAVTSFVGLASGDSDTVQFTITDAQSLRADPVVTVGGRAAVRQVGNRAESPQAESYTYLFTANAGTDSEGENTVAIAAVDAAGNTASTTRTATLDFTGPRTRIVTPGDRTLWNAAVAISGTVSDGGLGVDVFSVNVQECSAATGACDGGFFNEASGNFDTAARTDLTVSDDGFAWQLTDLPRTALSDGFFYEVTIEALDGVANIGSETRRFEFSDVVLPQVDALVANRVGNNVTLSWQNVGAAADTHLVHYATTEAALPYAGAGLVEGDSAIAVPGGATTSFAFTALPAGTYFFNVTARAGVVEGGYTREVRVVVP